MFQDPTIHKTGSNSYDVSFGDDKGLFVEFSHEPEYQEALSAAEGRAVYKDVSYITILFPADKTKKVFRRVKMEDDNSGPSDLTRFPKQWAAFQAQQEQIPDGMPLEHWPPMTKARVKELKSLHLHTVEQLAALTDQNGPSIGLDWRKLRDMALNFTASAKDGAAVTKLTHENEILRGDIDMLKQQIAVLSAKATEDAEEPRRRGRPPLHATGV